MKQFGLKMEDRDAAEIIPLIDYALHTGQPVELGLYHGNRDVHETFIDCVENTGLPVNTHLNHHLLNVFGIHDYLQELKAAVETSLKLGSAYSITHVGTTPMSSRPQCREAMFDHLLENLILMDTICVNYGYHIFIENTFQNIAFYHRLCQLIQVAGLHCLHFCFDMGHAKVWSDNTLSQWFTFLDERQQCGMQLHVHLHTNRGLDDEHLSFMEADTMGLTATDWFTEIRDYYQALQSIDTRYPSARKIFEVNPQKAIANMQWVRHKMDQLTV